jgi:hypothetical protein
MSVVARLRRVKFWDADFCTFASTQFFDEAGPNKKPFIGGSIRINPCGLEENKRFAKRGGIR